MTLPAGLRVTRAMLIARARFAGHPTLDLPFDRILEALYARGGIRYVAAQLGVNPKTADRWLKQFGILPPAEITRWARTLRAAR